MIGTFSAILFRIGEVHRALATESSKRSPDGARLAKLKRLKISLQHRLARVIDQVERARPAAPSPAQAAIRAPAQKGG